MSTVEARLDATAPLPALALPSAGWRAASLDLLFAGLCLLSLLPFLLIAHPPIVDFPNHAARLWIACNGSDPAVAAMYRYQLGIIPNLAADLVNRPLCGLVEPKLVLRLLTAGSLSLIYASGWLIQRKLFGRSNAFLLLMPAIGFNLVTTMGYVNFLAGIAVLLLMVALAIGREDRPRQMLLLGNVGGLVLFFCHIFALAVALALFFGFRLRHAERTPRGVAEAAVATALMFALPLLLIPLVPSSGDPMGFGWYGRLRTLGALTMAPHVYVGLFSLMLLIPLYLLLRSGAARLAPAMVLPLVALGGYVLLVPGEVGDAVDIDARSLVALGYLVFASLQPVRGIPALSVGVTGVSLGLIALNLWMAATAWASFDRDMRDLRSAFHALPQHATVLTVTEKASDRPVQPFAYAHLTSYATIDRRIFNPLEFNGTGMQPLAVTPRFASFDTPVSPPIPTATARAFQNPGPAELLKARRGRATYALRWQERFDYVIYYHLGAEPNFAPEALETVRRGSFFSILKVRKVPAA